jgi:hypothetical protein
VSDLQIEISCLAGLMFSSLLIARLKESFLISAQTNKSPEVLPSRVSLSLSLSLSAQAVSISIYFDDCLRRRSPTRATRRVTSISIKQCLAQQRRVMTTKSDFCALFLPAVLHFCAVCVHGRPDNVVLILTDDQDSTKTGFVSANTFFMSRFCRAATTQSSQRDTSYTIFHLFVTLYYIMEAIFDFYQRVCFQQMQIYDIISLWPNLFPLNSNGQYDTTYSLLLKKDKKKSRFLKLSAEFEVFYSQYLDIVD